MFYIILIIDRDVLQRCLIYQNNKKNRRLRRRDELTANPHFLFLKPECPRSNKTPCFSRLMLPYNGTARSTFAECLRTRAPDSPRKSAGFLFFSKKRRLNARLSSEANSLGRGRPVDGFECEKQQSRTPPCGGSEGGGGSNICDRDQLFC